MTRRPGNSMRELLILGLTWGALAAICIDAAAFAETPRKPPSTIPPRRSSQLQQAPAGVNTSLPRLPYLPWSERCWTRMFDAGIKYVRIGQYEDTSDQTGWDWVEQKKGQLSVGKEVDEYVDSLVENGAVIELQLLYGNPIYTSPAGLLPTTITPTTGAVHNRDLGLYSIFWPPTTPDQVSAFMRYTRFMVERYKGKIRYYSLWNEEDISYWNPYQSARDYGNLLGAFSRTVRETDPNARIVFGGLAARSPEFARQALEVCQCAGDLDVFAYHIYPGGFYANTPPEEMDSKDHDNPTTDGLRDAVKAFPGIPGGLQFWDDEYNSAIGFTPDMDESIQAKYVPRTIVYNWAEGVPTFVWELINDTSTSEGNNFGIINGKLFKSSDFQPRPVFYTIQRTNALFGDTSRDPSIEMRVLDAKPLEAAGKVPFFSYGFKSRTGKAIVAYWLGSKVVAGHPSPPVYVDISLLNSGIIDPVLIDLESNTISPLTWEQSATGQSLRLPVRDSVMAVADAAYFDWSVLPEIPAGLLATAKGKTVSLKWMAAGGEATEIVVETRASLSDKWVDIAHLPGSATSYQATGLPRANRGSYRVYAANQAGKSGYSNIAHVNSGDD